MYALAGYIGLFCLHKHQLQTLTVRLYSEERILSIFHNGHNSISELIKTAECIGLLAEALHVKNSKYQNKRDITRLYIA